MKQRKRQLYLLFSSSKDNLDIPKLGVGLITHWKVRVPMQCTMLWAGRTSFSPSNYSLLIFDRQPKLFCEENEQTTYVKNKLLFKNIHHWKGLISLSSNNPAPKALGLPLNWRKKHTGGSLYGVICFVRLIHSFSLSCTSTGCLIEKPRND